ncbi:MAG: outer membrane beta-barrel protein, partial [Flavobacteriales bacterium]|nr:outer membrane beta-barrel protein [Flavobacteriales bacterium]
MERSIAILSAILFAGIGQAQDVPAKEAVASRFHIGVQGSVDHAYRTLELNQRTGPSERIMENRNHAEEPRLGCTGALFMGYTFSSRFGLEAGLGYALRGWQLDISKLTFGDQIEPRRGSIYQTHDELKAIRRSFHYLDIPVR